jgi:hypothetical protein
MSDGTDPFVERINTWSSQIIDDPAVARDPIVALQGWALREELKRRPTSQPSLLHAVESKLTPTLPNGSIPTFIERAANGFTNLLNDLDQPEPNLQHVRRESRDVFFSVLDALILAEEAGDDAAHVAARGLFNQVIAEVYAFEPVANLAAELERWGRGSETRLSDLLCTAVSRLFDGRVVSREVAAVEVVEEFVPIGDFLRRSASQAGSFLTLADLAKRLAETPFWYLKWAAQRLRVSVITRARELRVEVFETDGAGASRALDGWEFRAGHARDAQTVPVKNGVAAIRMPDRIDPSHFLLQARNPDTRQWIDLHARVEA